MRLRHCLPSAVLFVACACAGGCATGNSRGWSGEGAMPFDTAQADCDAKTRELAAGKVREHAFDACMAGHGWRRP